MRRKYPHGDRETCALQQDWWMTALDMSQRVAVYWPDSPTAPTLVGYYDSVSLANAAADGATSSGVRPRVEINWAHADISHLQVGPVAHPDAREDLPSWIDEDPK